MVVGEIGYGKYDGQAQEYAEHFAFEILVLMHREGAHHKQIQQTQAAINRNELNELGALSTILHQQTQCEVQHVNSIAPSACSTIVHVLTLVRARVFEREIED